MGDDFTIETVEIEHKYDGNDIKLTDFVKFAEDMKPTDKVEVASWDFYYSGPKLPFEFIRFRNGPKPELTIKIKTEDKNNNDRIEIDLPLASSITEWLVSKFVGLFSFKENFRVFKHCTIYWYEKVDIVYYIIYSKDMVELGRRVEAEARKDYPFKTKEEAVAVVKDMEQKMAAIGITPQKRMRKSMWETFQRQ